MPPEAWWDVGAYGEERNKEYLIDAAVGVGCGGIMSGWRRKTQLVWLFCEFGITKYSGYPEYR